MCGCLSCAPYWGPGLQQPWLGTKPMTLWLSAHFRSMNIQKNNFSLNFHSFRKPLIKNDDRALAGVVQWIECWPMNQMVTSWILSLGLMPALLARSPVGGMQEATTHWCFCPSLPPFPSLKINKIFKKTSAQSPPPLTVSKRNLLPTLMLPKHPEFLFTEHLLPCV